MARAIDALTVLCILWALVITQIFWFMNRLSERFDPEPWGRTFVATMSFVVLSALYEMVFLVRSKGQTPGKDLMKMRVIPTDGSDRVKTVRAFVRWLLPGVLAVAFVASPWLGAATVAAIAATALLPGRRAVHDLVAATMVVPYDRDNEDPAAGKRAHSWRRQRLLERRITGDGPGRGGAGEEDGEDQVGDDEVGDEYGRRARNGHHARFN